MVNNHYRWDFIGLSTDEKPTPATSEKVVDGSTFYCSDNSKLYVWCKDNWYEKTVSGGGGGTSNFNDLNNRPKYNGTDMTSSTNIPEVKTYSPFTGTDGTSAGTSGLVPAPATTDSGKFLKADGTWDTAGGGGGDSVYSTVTTSNSATGGAVYIGNLGTDQQAVQDPSATDNHYKYFWALPYSNNGTTYGKPGQGTVNILGTANGNDSVAIGLDAGNYNVSYSVAVGGGAGVGASGVSIGYNAGTSQDLTGNVCIGDDARITQSGVRDSVSLGRKARATRIGEVNVGTGASTIGYNNTTYRVIGGVHDPVDVHDAATKGYVDQTVTTLYIDTLNFPSDPNTPLTNQCFYKEKDLLNTYSLSEIRDGVMTGNVKLCVVDLNNLNFYNFTYLGCSTDSLSINLQIHDLASSSIIEFTSDANTQAEFTFSINPV